MTDDRPETPEEDPFEAVVRQMEEQAANLKAELPPDLDEEFDERMRSLDQKVAAQKAVRDNVKKEEARKTQLDRDATRGLGIGLNVAYALIGLPLVGAGLGWFLDKQTGASFWTGLCVVGGLIFAIAYTVLLMNQDA
jgi:F0F1-type ATP synthase assembly protein I